ncbi:MAG: CBS domain-containing protein, partial [Anaerolineae bacterium]|nr:CBS domain-containing protein [Anaerolineae bacterium]
GNWTWCGEFLQHPLTDAQHAVFERLAENALTLHIQGFTVVLTSTTLAEPVDELATLAHKLRERVDAEALLMLIEVPESEGSRIHVIARSVVNNVDVGEVLRVFDGGGHARAAAALVKERSLSSLTSQLIELLEQRILPAIRVADMLSQNVQSIQMSATVGEAQRAMLETGHEGYPVLDGDRLVGLLTRRAVDRAMRHDMHKASVREVMEPGQVAVTPADSIETLKDRMLDSGWGQMPVIDQAGHLVGIVTRTDLIKRWGSRPAEPHRREEMRARLQLALPPVLNALLEAVRAAATTANLGLYLVGGIVRDLLLGRPNLDIDLVVEGDAIALAQALQHNLGGTLHAHRQFGTAKWLLDDQLAAKLGFPQAAEQLPPTIDFATSRAEFYEAPSVLPTVRRSSIKLDLHRRDFTMNTLAIRLAPPPDGELLDFYKGEQDLRDGLVRVLHSLSFVDDPTRILRAVRFEQRFDFRIEARTLDRLTAALPLIPRLSGDRLRHELNLILQERDPLRNLERLAELGVLEAIDPALQLDERARAVFAQLPALRAAPPLDPCPADFDDWRVLALAVLVCEQPAEDITRLCARLMTANRICDHLLAVQRACQHLPALPTYNPAEVVEALEPGGPLAWLALWLFADAQRQEVLGKFVGEWQPIKPSLNGNDLLRMGAPAGPPIGAILRDLRRAWLNGEITDAEDETRYAQRRIEAHTA